MATEPLASLSLTHVHYIPGDKVSYACAWLALVPQGLCVAYVTLIWSTREVEIMSMFAGQMACEAVNWALKRLIRQERPAVMTGKGYGMPSSHAQFAFFFAVSISLFLLVRHGQAGPGYLSSDRSASIPKPSPNSNQSPVTPQLNFGSNEKSFSSSPSTSQRPAPLHPISLPTRIFTSFASLVTASLVASSRVYLNYHTPQQVAVGAAAGTICGLVWFRLTDRVRRSGLLHSWFLDTPVARFFRIKDLVVGDDLVEVEWDRWRGLVESERDRRIVDESETTMWKSKKT